MTVINHKEQGNQHHKRIRKKERKEEKKKESIRYGEKGESEEEEKGREEREMVRKGQRGMEEEGRDAEEEECKQIQKDLTGWTMVMTNKRQRKMVQIFVKVDEAKVTPTEVNLTDGKVEGRRDETDPERRGTCMRQCMKKCLEETKS